MTLSCLPQLRYLAAMILALLIAPYVYGNGENEECPDCDGRCPLVAVKSNMLYDAALTPDIGVEISLSERFSVGLEGVYAWWSNDKAHRYWRIRGGWLDVNCWLGKRACSRRLAGHHVGMYVSLHGYDFEFGHKGWQARRPTFGAGVSYGYSLPLTGRLSLDMHVRIGYAGGKVTEYVPQCGEYVCVRRFNSRYFGLTGLGVSLVWFPGRGRSNNPSR